jgi:hypothetical protein
MGWEHTAREERLAPVGTYEPETYKVKVYDTFDQRRLIAAALTIRNGMSVPEFFLFAADYVMDRHRRLAVVRKVYRKAARRIVAAGKTPEAQRLHMDAAWAACVQVWRAREEEARKREAAAR